MSNWTHVAGIIRIDAIRFSNEDNLNFDELIGKECDYFDSNEIWKDMKEHPDNYLPFGCEGSLKKSVWTNPNINHIASYTISIFGDLREHSSTSAIINWFKKKCEQIPMIRQAVITVENEYFGTESWTYKKEEIIKKIKK